MERCRPCTRRLHSQCEGVNPDLLTWCECPCYTGEEADPLLRFIKNAGVVTDHGIIPLPRFDSKDGR